MTIFIFLFFVPSLFLFSPRVFTTMILGLLFFHLFAFVTHAQTQMSPWKITQRGLNCSSFTWFWAFRLTSTDLPCVPSACSCSGGGCTEVTCRSLDSTTVPDMPPGMIGYVGGCSMFFLQSGSSVWAATPGCHNYADVGSTYASCSGGAVTFNWHERSINCFGSPTIECDVPSIVCTRSLNNQCGLNSRANCSAWRAPTTTSSTTHPSVASFLVFAPFYVAMLVLFSQTF